MNWCLVPTPTDLIAPMWGPNLIDIKKKKAAQVTPACGLVASDHMIKLFASGVRCSRQWFSRVRCFRVSRRACYNRPLDTPQGF